VVLEAVGGFLVIPFAVFAAVLLLLRRTLRALPPADTATERPPAERP
jgi:hypothetical protein